MISDPPSVDYSMSVANIYEILIEAYWTRLTRRFTSSDFDDILASFSEGEWSVPVDYFTAG